MKVTFDRLKFQGEGSANSSSASNTNLVMMGLDLFQSFFFLGNNACYAIGLSY